LLDIQIVVNKILIRNGSRPDTSCAIKGVRPHQMASEDSNMKIFALCAFLLLALAAVQAKSTPETKSISPKNLKKAAG